MHTTSVPALVLRRTYDASPERLYRAWTDPELARQFLCPEGVKIAEIDLQPRAGGTYRIVMQKEDGERLVVRGTYRDVQPNRRLSMTWSWEEDDPADQYESLLSIEFVPHGNRTVLTLTHEQLRTLETRENHEHGWTSILDKMETLDR